MIRVAVATDAVALTAAEKAAGLAALGHIFPPDRYPYPEAEVLARWTLNLDRADMITRVAEHEGRVTGYAATAHEWMEHLGVVPDLWGTGLASELHDVALDDIQARGYDHALLWVLEENVRAHRFYRRRGWTYTGVEGRAVWPPQPREVQMRRELGAFLAPSRHFSQDPT